MKKNEKLLTITALICAIASLSFAAMNYVRAAGQVNYTNAGGAITAGDIVDLGDRYGVALGDIAATTGTGIVMTEGIFDLSLGPNETVVIGDKLYLTGVLLTETAASDAYVGTAVEALTTVAATNLLEVRLNAPYTSDGLTVTYTNLGATAAITNVVVTQNGKVVTYTNIGP